MEKGQQPLYREDDGTASRAGRAVRLTLHWRAGNSGHPLQGYLAALLLSNVTLTATILIVRFLPAFAYPAALNILGILIIALLWGAGPSLFATLIEALLLNLVLLPPQFAWSFHALSQWADTVSFLLIGFVISLIASRVESARTQAVGARQRLHDLFMQAPANIAVLLGPQHRFELANPSFLRTAERSHVIGKTAREVFPEAEQDPFMQVLDQVYTTGIPFVGNEVWVQMRSSDRLKGGYFTFVCQPTRASSGEVDGLLIHGVEVTEQVKARQRTKGALDALLAMAEVLVQSPAQEGAAQQGFMDQSQQVVSRLATLARQVLGCERVGILRVEPETHYLQPLALIGSLTEEQNQWFTQLARCPLGDYLAPPLIDRLLAGEVVEAHLSEQTVTAIVPPSFAPLCVGSRLLGLLLLEWGDGKGPPSPEERVLAGAVSKLAALMIERERLLREHTEARANELAAREATQRMDTFLGIASHELKTPLTVIKGNLQLITWQVQDMPVNAEERTGSLPQMLADIGQQVNRLTRLVNDLIEVSRAHTDTLEMHMEICDLGAIVAKTVEEQRILAPARTIQFQRAERGIVPVYADSDRLGQVVRNYLANALKYSSPDQPVEVWVEQEDRSARVLVCDRGPGLDSTQRERVWERFHRVEGVKVLSGSSVGLGLGLYISRLIIERHQGLVGVESMPGEGSTFWFALPALEMEEEEDMSEPGSVLQEG